MIHKNILFGVLNPTSVPVPPPYIYNQSTSLTSNSPSTIYDYYGRCVALSNDDSTYVVGSDETSMSNNVNNTAGPGHVYVYKRNINTTPWSSITTPYAILSANDGHINDSFGKSVAVSQDGKTIIVGAPGAKINQNVRQGAAYVFTWDNNSNTWIQTHKLSAHNGTPEDSYGYSVAISHDATTIAIGSNTDDVVNNYRVGSAYVYSLVNITTGIADLEANTLTVTSINNANSITIGSAITGIGIPANTTITKIVSGYGGIGVYKISTTIGNNILSNIAINVSTSWEMETQIIATNSKPDDNFGCSLALNNNGSMLVVGSSGCDIDSIPNAGAVYTYDRITTSNTTAWINETKSWANIPIAGAGYGFSIALTTDTLGLVVGAPLVNGGSVYILDRDINSPWRQRFVLLEPSSKPGDRYGWSVSVAETLRFITVGAPGYNIPTNPGNSGEFGTIYVYVNEGTGWLQTAKLIPNDSDIGDNFGYSVSMSDDALSVAGGSPLKSINSLALPSTTYIHGSTYIFTQ